MAKNYVIVIALDGHRDQFRGFIDTSFGQNSVIDPTRFTHPFYWIFILNFEQVSVINLTLRHTDNVTLK